MGAELPAANLLYLLFFIGSLLPPIHAKSSLGSAVMSIMG